MADTRTFDLKIYIQVINIYLFDELSDPIKVSGPPSDAFMCVIFDIFEFNKLSVLNQKTFGTDIKYVLRIAKS